MEENINLPQSELNGIWKAFYSEVGSISEPDSSPEEQATIKFNDGFLSGDDTFGGKYSGVYSVKEGKFSAKIEVTSSGSDVKSILAIDFPYTLEMFGDYSSPDHFSVVGIIVGLEKEVVVNYRRIES